MESKSNDKIHLVQIAPVSGRWEVNCRPVAFWALDSEGQVHAAFLSSEGYLEFASRRESYDRAIETVNMQRVSE